MNFQTETSTNSQSRKNQHEHIEYTADVELDEWDDVKAGRGASIRDSIILLRERKYGIPMKDKYDTLASGEYEYPKAPKFLKLRVYWARLVRW